jgi:homocysteine S-methyltransferase
MDIQERIISLFENHPFAINDGAFSTQLEAMGCDINDELWSAKILYEDPAKVKAVHTQYFEAGADFSTCGSYQASVPGFMKKGFTEERSRELIRESMRLLKEAEEEYLAEHPARAAELFVGGSCGPYGAYLANGAEYTGDYGHSKEDRESIRHFHKERMELLKEGGAEFFGAETIPCLWEAEMLADLAEELGLPVWNSFSCRDGKHISDGTPIADCARALQGRDHIIAIGINCTHPRYISSLIREIRDAIGDDRRIIVYPNGGEDYDPVTKMWSGRYAAGNFKGLARGWIADGADILGGCCRTTPDDIRSLSELRTEMESSGN